MVNWAKLFPGAGLPGGTPTGIAPPSPQSGGPILPYTNPQTLGLLQAGKAISSYAQPSTMPKGGIGPMLLDAAMGYTSGQQQGQQQNFQNEQMNTQRQLQQQQLAAGQLAAQNVTKTTEMAAKLAQDPMIQNKYPVIAAQLANPATAAAGLKSLTNVRAKEAEFGMKPPYAGAIPDGKGGWKPDPLYQKSREDIQRSGAAATAMAQGGGRILTPAQNAVDKAYAKEYVDWNVQGGRADTMKGITQLRSVINTLGDKEANISGADVGMQPDALLALTNPEALDAQELVSEVVQRNLRVVLGAQFTEKEGSALIKRAYNPMLDESTNKKRLDSLVTTMEKAVAAKDAAARYYEENGSLVGFDGKVYTMDDIKEEAFGKPAEQTFPVASPGAIQHLKSNPDLARDFDAKYGEGMAKKVLGK